MLSRGVSVYYNIGLAVLATACIGHVDGWAAVTSIILSVDHVCEV